MLYWLPLLRRGDGQDAVCHWNSRAGDLKPLRIEWRGHQVCRFACKPDARKQRSGASPARNQVPPSRPTRVIGRQSLDLRRASQIARSCRRGGTPAIDGRFPRFRVGSAGCEAPPASDTCWRAAVLIGCEGDHSLIAPTGAAKARSIAESHRRATANRYFLQLPTREKTQPLPIGRKERVVGSLCARAKALLRGCPVVADKSAVCRLNGHIGELCSVRLK